MTNTYTRKKSLCERTLQLDLPEYRRCNACCRMVGKIEQFFLSKRKQILFMSATVLSITSASDRTCR